MKGYKSGVGVTCRVPDDYKRLRLRSWAGLSFEWLQYTERDSFHSQSIAALVREVVHLSKKIRDKNPALVDLGCGPGLLLRAVRSRELFTRLVGIDFCSDMLRVAQACNVEAFAQIDYQCLDLEAPLGKWSSALTHSFDIATGAFLLDEVGDLSACFRSAAHLLRPQGYFIAATLAPERERNRYAINLREISATSAKPVLLTKSLSLNGHRTPFNYFRFIRQPADLLLCAEDAGFQTIFDRRISAAQLHARPEGPFLRLLSFQRRR